MVDDRLFKQAGLKVTPHRRAMLRILDTADGPLTAEQVYEALDPAERANLSTVYRALGTMSEHGVLQRSVHQDGVIYYQLNGEHHSHRLVCVRCHASVPIEGCPFEQMDIKRASLRLEFGAKPRLSNSFLQQGAFSLPVRRGTVPAGVSFAAWSKNQPTVCFTRSCSSARLALLKRSSVPTR